MELMRYLRAVQRRWPLVAALLVIGAIGGYATGISRGGATSPKDYYRATATMLAAQPSGGTTNTASKAPNLAQTAFLVSSGDMPQRVGDELGVDPAAFANQVAGEAFTQLGTVEITAVSASPEQATQLADTFASVYLQKLQADAQTAADAERDSVLKRLDDIKGQQAALNLALAAEPTNTDLLAQRDSLVNQYRLVYEQFSQLANAGQPTAGMSLLQPAAPTRITETEFKGRIQDAKNGPDPKATQTQGAASNTAKKYEEPSSGPGPVTRGLIGGLLGLALGVVAALLLDHFDTRLRTKADVETAFGAPVIAEIPPLTADQASHTDVVSRVLPRSRFAESYRVLRTAITFVTGADAMSTVPSQPGANGSGNGNGTGSSSVETSDETRALTAEEEHRATVVLVTSAGPEEGKTVTVANLAAMLAEGGERVLVLNCDFRRPRLHKYLESHAEDGEVAVTDVGQFRMVQTTVKGVRMITGIGEGDPDANPAEIVAYQRRVVELARSRFDYILLDTAPLLTTNDASGVLPEADLVIVVCRVGKTTKNAAERVSELLLRMGAPVLGVVLTDSTDAPAAQYYYYYLDGADGSPRRDRSRAVAGAPVESGSTVGEPVRH